MTPTQLFAVARMAGALTPDADLLARYAGERDQSAFEELVRLHGPLVWAVCRRLLPCHADAEDAFQAVFLTLVRSASRIRGGSALPAWLHGVAVRVASRARRASARRGRREEAAASPEADRSLSGAAWESLVAVVHEEVQKLPEAERTVFVLCELEGVSQSDAAARLGWPLGSVSGRLCKARQRLLDLLAARGVAPVAAVGIGITTGAASAVPSELFEVVSSFPGTPAAASGAAAALARGLLEGVTMRVKLTAAVAVVVAAFGISGGAALLSRAEAQPLGSETRPLGLTGAPAGGNAGPGAGNPLLLPPGAVDTGSGRAAAAWEYKFVNVKSDQKEFERSITAHGREGWEFCSSERFAQSELVLVFKKRGGNPPAAGTVPGAPSALGGRTFTPDGGKVELGGNPKAGELTFVLLKNALSSEVEGVLRKIYPTISVAADPRLNGLFIKADAKTLKEVLAMIERLDKK